MNFNDVKYYTMEFKSKDYWEDVLAGSVTTVFEEFSTVSLASMLVAKGYLKSRQSEFLVEEITRLVFAWAYMVIFMAMRRKDLAYFTSGMVMVLFIYKIIEYFTTKNPLTYAYQKASELAFGVAKRMSNLAQGSQQQFFPKTAQVMNPPKINKKPIIEIPNMSW